MNRKLLFFETLEIKSYRCIETVVCRQNGNIRDYADIPHLLVLANLESYNAILIEQKISQKDRLLKLRNTAKKQLEKILSLDLKKDLLVI